MTQQQIRAQAKKLREQFESLQAENEELRAALEKIAYPDLFESSNVPEVMVAYMREVAKEAIAAAKPVVEGGELTKEAT